MIQETKEDDAAAAKQKEQEAEKKIEDLQEAYTKEIAELEKKKCSNYKWKSLVILQQRERM